MNLFVLAVLVKALYDSHRSSWIIEIRGAYLYGASPCDEKFQGILRAADPPNTDDGDFDRPCSLIHHADSHWFNGWAGEASGYIGKAWCASLDVNSHSDKSI